MNTRYLNGLAKLNSHRNISDILQDVIDNVLTILMLLFDYRYNFNCFVMAFLCLFLY
jgi:hypothetical protein